MFPATSLVGAAGFEPATFGSQSRSGESEKLNEAENVQRFRRSSLVGRLAHLAPLAPLAQLAGFLYPDLTPALSPPASPEAVGLTDATSLRNFTIQRRS